LNYNGDYLGGTCFFAGQGRSNKPDLHEINIGKTWKRISFNILDEINTYLPKVNINEVAKIKISIYAAGNGCEASVYVDDIQIDNSPDYVYDIINGNFEEDYEIGWLRGGDQSDGINIVENVTDGDNDSDYELMVYQKGGSDVEAYQVVDIPTPDLFFTAKIRGSFTTCNYGYNAGEAGLDIIYFDKYCSVLGATTYYVGWEQGSTPTEHRTLISSDEWREISFNIRKEIRDYLPGVSMDKIAKIGIYIFAEGNGCEATIYADDISLSE